MKDDYSLAKITEVMPDSKGLVRSVRVCCRKRNKRENPVKYTSKLLTEEIVAVQRLSLLVPCEQKEVTVNYSLLN